MWAKIYLFNFPRPKNDGLVCPLAKVAVTTSSSSKFEKACRPNRVSSGAEAEYFVSLSRSYAIIVVLKNLPSKKKKSLDDVDTTWQSF